MSGFYFGNHDQHTFLLHLLAMTLHTPNNAIRHNKLVEFTYRILDENGQVLEQIDLPVSYVHGSEFGLWQRIEAAMENRRAGDTVEVLIHPEDAFGDPDPTLQLTQSLSDVPQQFRHIGAEADFENEHGDVHRFRVTDIDPDGETLILDGNHPLAGKTLKFFLSILNVRDATDEEISNPDALNSPSLH